MIIKTILLKIKQPNVLEFKIIRKTYSKVCNSGIDYLSMQWPNKISHSQLYAYLKNKSVIPSSILNEAVRLIRSRCLLSFSIIWEVTGVLNFTIMVSSTMRGGKDAVFRGLSLLENLILSIA